MRLQNWLDDAYNLHGYLKAKKALAEFLGKPVEIDRIGYERIRWQEETWKTGLVHVARDELGRFVSWKMVKK